jgi:regulator of RNase E activity RraA
VVQRSQFGSDGLPDPPSRDLVDELLTYEVAWISDSMGLNLMDPQIRPIHPGVRRVAGPALTVTVPPGDFLMISAALKVSRPGDILVVDGRGDTSRAVWGEYFSCWARGLGVEAVLIDGAARDAGGIEALGYPVFARATTPRQPTLNGPGEVNVPISCGGVCVLPGDLIVADREGAVVIPRRNLDPILDCIRQTAEGERTHHGLPAGGRKEYDSYFDLAFAPRIAALTGSGPRPVEGADGGAAGSET